MEAVIIWMQAATLGTIIVGGLVVVAKALGKLDRVATQVDNGFRENHADHKQIFGKLEQHDREIIGIRGKIEKYHGGD